MSILQNDVPVSSFRNHATREKKKKENQPACQHCRRLSKYGSCGTREAEMTGWTRPPPQQCPIVVFVCVCGICIYI